MMGSIHLITGPVASGKTSRLVEIVRASPAPATLVRWAGDSRPFRARGGMPDCAVVCVAALGDAAPATPLIAVDEGQFFADLAPACERWARAGARVVVAALDGDYARAPFRGVCDLLPLCERVDKLLAVCACGAPAAFSARVGAGGAPRVQVGGPEMYAAACRRCHKIEVSHPCDIVRLSDCDKKMEDPNVSIWDKKMGESKGFAARLDKLYVEGRDLADPNALADLLNQTLPVTESERQMAFFVSFLVESADTELKRKTLVASMSRTRQLYLLLLDINTIKPALGCHGWNITLVDGAYAVVRSAEPHVAAQPHVAARKTMSPEECGAVVDGIAENKYSNRVTAENKYSNQVALWGDTETEVSSVVCPEGRRPEGRRPEGRRPEGRRPEGRRPGGGRRGGRN